MYSLSKFEFELTLNQYIDNRNYRIGENIDSVCDVFLTIARAVITYKVKGKGTLQNAVLFERVRSRLSKLLNTLSSLHFSISECTKFVRSHVLWRILYF